MLEVLASGEIAGGSAGRCWWARSGGSRWRREPSPCRGLGGSDSAARVLLGTVTASGTAWPGTVSHTPLLCGLITGCSRLLGVPCVPLVSGAPVPCAPLVTDASVPCIPLLIDVPVPCIPLVINAPVSSVPLVTDAPVPCIPLVTDAPVPATLWSLMLPSPAFLWSLMLLSLVPSDHRCSCSLHAFGHQCSVPCVLLVTDVPVPCIPLVADTPVPATLCSPMFLSPASLWSLMLLICPLYPTGHGAGDKQHSSASCKGTPGTVVTQHQALLRTGGQGGDPIPCHYIWELC